MTDNEKELVLNPLPVRTWNSLKMNETAFSGGIPSGVCDPAIVCGSDKVNVYHNSGNELSDMFTGVKSASGDDFASVTEIADDNIILIEADENANVTEPIELNYSFTSDQAAKLFIHAKKNSVLPVSVALTDGSLNDKTSALEIKILADDGASVCLSVAELMGNGDTVLTDIGCKCSDKASMKLAKVELGGIREFCGVYCDLVGKASRFTADSAYRVKEGQSLDMNYIVRHFGKKTESEISASGVLENGSKKLFRGTIDLIKGCAGAVGTENEDILLLGDSQINQTIPLILCDEEDVEGNHGASIGKLDEDIIFYFGSRGISRESAEEIIARAKLDAVCAKLCSGNLKNLVAAYLESGEKEDCDE